MIECKIKKIKEKFFYTLSHKHIFSQNNGKKSRALTFLNYHLRKIIIIIFVFDRAVMTGICAPCFSVKKIGFI